MITVITFKIMQIKFFMSIIETSDMSMTEFRLKILADSIFGFDCFDKFIKQKR